MKIEKTMKKCPICKGEGTLPDSIAKALPKPPKPGVKMKCPACSGRGFTPVTRKE